MCGVNLTSTCDDLASRPSRCVANCRCRPKMAKAHPYARQWATWSRQCATSRETLRQKQINLDNNGRHEHSTEIDFLKIFNIHQVYNHDNYLKTKKKYKCMTETTNLSVNYNMETAMITILVYIEGRTSHTTNVHGMDEYAQTCCLLKYKVSIIQ